MKKANSTQLARVYGGLIVLLISILISVSATAQCSLSCNDLVQISLDGDCEVTVTSDMVLAGGNCPNGNLVVEIKVNSVWVPAILTGAHINQTIQVRVRDLVSGNLCWGFIHVEDKLAPTITCTDIPLSCAVSEYSPEYLLNVLNINDAYPLVDENCGPFTLTHIDTWHDLPCNGTINGFTDVSAYVKRKWTATDPSGNFTICTQFIYFFRRHVQSIVFPPNVTVSCEAPITDPDVTGVPYILDFGLQFPLFPNNTYCELNVIYTDQVLPVCDGTYKIIRTWTAYDWCLPTSQVPPNTNPLTYIQFIKVLDEQGPDFECPADLTVSANQDECCGLVDLPDVLITDNCSRVSSIQAMVTTFDFYDPTQQTGMFAINGTVSNYPGNNLWVPDTMGVFGLTTNCFPLGTHTVTYIVTDDCGNTSDCTFRLTVLDLEPPAASCQTVTTVAITTDDPADCYGPSNSSPANQCAFGGVVKIPAINFNSGSYDNCADVIFTVRRMPPYSPCIESLASQGGGCEYQVATLENDTIKFYCCEVGTTQTIILRVYQVDVNGSVVFDLDGNAIFNECMIQVEVQDKLKPTCTAPPTVVVNCQNFDPTLWAYGIPTIFDNCCLLSAPNNFIYQGVAQCGLSVTNNFSNFDTVCNRGTIRRTFTVTDCHNLSTTCSQLIVVNYVQDYYVRFPDDRIVTVCDGTANFGAPTFFGEDCELLATSFEDQIFTVVEDACYKIERTWTVLNWCTYNPNLPCIDIPNPNPTIINSQANLTGPTVSACNNQIPGFAPTVVRINPTDLTTTNYCTFYDANANCYRYKQIIKIIDGVAPVIQCPASPVIFCDFTQNDPNFYNALYYFDVATRSHDLCEGPVDLTITATDACSLADINIRYLLFLDLDGDGIMETVINSNTNNLPVAQQPTPGTFFFGNANNPNFAGGTNYTFDFRPVGVNQKYIFALQTTVSGTNKTGAVRWNTRSSQFNYVIPEIPYGTHKIKWFVSDGCGNESLCEYVFIVRDCKPPTVTCINGLSINNMPGGMISLWAIDFFPSTSLPYDNCTPANRLKFGIRRSGTGTGFPVNSPGVNFTCADIGTQPVEIWAIDLAGNADFCETYVIIQDNNGNCPLTGANATVAGALKTELQLGLEEANVELEATPPAAAPPMTAVKLSNNTGNYLFNNALPINSSYTVTPTKDDNHLNGVTTYDLVLISKHILGLEPLSSPYKMIAADANKSGSITTSDIVELRKLILGIYQELPSNTSWRFVDKSFVFPTPSNPFQTLFPENKSLTSVQTNMLAEDFVAIKIGDMNDNALPNGLQNMDDRTAGTLYFDIDLSGLSTQQGEAQDDQIKAGEEVTVHFKAAEKNAGYQFTLDFPALEVQALLPGANMTEQNFGLFAADHTLTVSVDGDAGEFAVKFRARQSGELSKMLRGSSRVTRAEAYDSRGEKMDIAFRFHGAKGSEVVGAGFELMQNTPNPWKDVTGITFHLPAAAQATLTISNVAGRVLKVIKGNYAKGANTVQISRAALEPGVLFYQLDTPTHSATKKMLVAE